MPPSQAVNQSGGSADSEINGSWPPDSDINGSWPPGNLDRSWLKLLLFASQLFGANGQGLKARHALCRAREGER